MRYFVHLNLEDAVYFVSSDFRKAPRDQQQYPPCTLYLLKNIIFKNSNEPENYFYSYVEEDYIEELTDNGAIDHIVEAHSPQSAVIITIFEGKE